MEECMICLEEKEKFIVFSKKLKRDGFSSPKQQNGSTHLRKTVCGLRSRI